MGFNSAFKGLSKVKSYSAVLHMLAVCIGVYLGSFLRNKFIISHTCHPDTLFIYMSEDLGICDYFLKPKTGVPHPKTFTKLWLKTVPFSTVFLVSFATL